VQLKNVRYQLNNGLIMIRRLLLLNLLILFLLTCGGNIKSTQNNSPSKFQIYDGKYDAHFPLSPVDEDIAKIESSVRLITNLTFYQAYDFSIESRIINVGITEEIIQKKSIKKYIVEQPASGSATILAQDLNKIALLTCAHVVYAPDTLINYFVDKSGKLTSYIRSIAIKSRESINIITMPGLKNIHVLVSDNDQDIAIVIATLDPMPIFPVPVFSYPMGKAGELNWGTFVYVIGFPYGKKLISTAIVSDPNRDKSNGFIIDATMHRGASGGLIIALRDGAPNFELVGMVSALSAEREYILRPDENLDEMEIGFGHPYEGDIIIDKRMKINYGITYAVSIEAIQKFIKKNQKKLSDAGFYL